MTGPRTSFQFLSTSRQPVSGPEWCRDWSKCYRNKKYPEGVYRYLVTKGACLDERDAQLLGAWKDAALTLIDGTTAEDTIRGPFDGDFVRFNKRWDERNPRCAYDVWRRLPEKLDALRSSLEGEKWSEFLKQLTCLKRRSGRQDRFGLSRATYVLHVFSEGEFPIYDNHTHQGFHRLTSGNYKGGFVPKTKRGSIEWYLRTFCDFIGDLRAICEAKTLEQWRHVDKALFAYGKHGDRPCAHLE